MGHYLKKKFSGRFCRGIAIHWVVVCGICRPVAPKKIALLYGSYNILFYFILKVEKKAGQRATEVISHDPRPNVSQCHDNAGPIFWPENFLKPGPAPKKQATGPKKAGLIIK